MASATHPSGHDDTGVDAPHKYKRLSTQAENPFSSLVSEQSIAVIPSFTLESGVTLRNVPVAYTTRGRLSPARDNAMIVCHALTGSADVGDWWGPMLGGPGRAMDISRFYVVCVNCLGSPYGTASPVTYKDGDPQQGRYGPEFPLTTIRDDVNLQRLLLDDLGIRQVAVAIGGSMGGMQVLEWAYFGKDYVRAIVPIATSSQHSAWGISWGEAQRQSIYSDPKYEDGYYSFDDPPTTGLGAARMSALLTYRSRDSFESRFGRNTPDPYRQQNINGSSPLLATSTPNEHWAIHNEGHRNAKSPHPASSSGTPVEESSSVLSPPHSANGTTTTFTDPQFSGTRPLTPTTPQSHIPPSRRASTYFSAQSYLRYQGNKFVKRFDSNCYIAITRKLDTHDVSRHRTPHSPAPTPDALLFSTATPSSPSSTPPTPVSTALSHILQPTLVIGIESDGLFTFAEQRELAAAIPHARLRTIDSPEGHDAFLLQFEQVNGHILAFLRDVLPEIMARRVGPGAGAGLGGDAAGDLRDDDGGEEEVGGVGEVTKSSMFGEVEVEDITAW
ncbi:MAG: homoserine O- acetyltransferase [Piccolia ochrophora]|nr:MAG: homoserine O- acetyltransferase [Piccolia ochrophora]